MLTTPYKGIERADPAVSVDEASLSSWPMKSSAAFSSSSSSSAAAFPSLPPLQRSPQQSPQPRWPNVHGFSSRHAENNMDDDDDDGYSSTATGRSGGYTTSMREDGGSTLQTRSPQARSSFPSSSMPQRRGSRHSGSCKIKSLIRL